MKQVAQFIKEVRTELTRVDWPKKNEFIGATIITLILVCLFTLYIGFIDKANKIIIYENIFTRIKK
ncbi:MAG: preprotein translocase subunit SecE [Novosphingobium sp.]|nr:preprotein translocase subunit SecE [Novosphingobium sp.]